MITDSNKMALRQKRSKRKRVQPTNEIEVIRSTRRERIDARNHIMIVRYYYWDQIRRRRYKDILEILGETEFFVEERTITNAFLDYSDLLDNLYKTKPSVKDLKKQYPSWGWEDN